MLKRCYSKTYQDHRPTYAGCSVAKEWLLFSVFRSWVQSQDYEGKALDKDLLVEGNKVYSPETCCFIDKALNNFLLSNLKTRGEYLLGVTKHGNKFKAQCSNPLTKSRGYLGLFSSEIEAHAAYMKEKRKIAEQLAAMQTDKRIAEAILRRFQC